MIKHVHAADVPKSPLIQGVVIVFNCFISRHDFHFVFKLSKSTYKRKILR